MIDLDELERKRKAAMQAGNTSVPWVQFITAMCDNAPELIAMARRTAWVEANPSHHAMPYYLRGMWIVSAPLNAEDCGYRVFNTWAEAIDAAMQEQKP